jgi:hypothetical protein
MPEMGRVRIHFCAALTQPPKLGARHYSSQAYVKSQLVSIDASRIDWPESTHPWVEYYPCVELFS